MTAKNILFLRVDDRIQQAALGNFLSGKLARLGRVYNISCDDVTGAEKLPADKYIYMFSEPIHRMKLQAKQGTAIDAALLDALADDEPIILKMIERAHFRHGRYRFHDIRNHLYYTHLAYWLEFLTANEIEQVIFGNVPHDGYDYLIYALAKHLNLEIDMFYNLQVRDSYMHTHRVEELFSPIATALESVEDEVGLENLSERMKTEFSSRTGMEAPLYMKPKVRHGRMVDAVLNGFRKHIVKTERRKMIHDEILEPAAKCVSQVDLNQKFIYFGLHVQPELTTNALGGRYVNQFLAIQLIARCLPDDVMLYVKEHPNMLKTRDPSGRFREFYSMITDLKNVKLVSTEINTFDLINRSLAVATITGTLGWEAAFLGKPALIFGNAFFKFFPSVFAIYTVDDMKTALQRIFNWDMSAEDCRKHALRYLKAIEEVSVDGLINHSYVPLSAHEDESWHAHRFEEVLNGVVFPDSHSGSADRIADVS
ncbi:hypothetical protein P4B35_15940 [Pontiellaceae bacterium B12227]|nr:hypothetical protein [Pontiellaceae bacterium B12227]